MPAVPTYLCRPHTMLFFLSVPTVTTCTRIYVKYSSLVSLNVTFVLVPAMTTYGGCIEYFIFVCATCDNMNQDECYIFFVDLTSVLYLLVPAVTTNAERTVIFLPMPTVTPCAKYVDCYISDFVSCDDLCRVCRLLYFYLC